MNQRVFWYALSTQHPLQMHDFRNWIDEYKRRVHWPQLFNTGDMMNYGRMVGDNISQHNPKFHDLPQAMQIGIFIQYTVENGGAVFFTDMDSMKAIINGISQWFQHEEALASRDESLI